jgi:hypothetical protein
MAKVPKHDYEKTYEESDKRIKKSSCSLSSDGDDAKHEVIITGSTHKCNICEKEFSSGQALGGHKRSHPLKKIKLETPSSPEISPNTYEESEKRMSSMRFLSTSAIVAEKLLKMEKHWVVTGDLTLLRRNLIIQQIMLFVSLLRLAIINLLLNIIKKIKLMVISLYQNGKRKIEEVESVLVVLKRLKIFCSFVQISTFVLVSHHQIGMARMSLVVIETVLMIS